MCGYDVVFICNVIDIEDKILVKVVVVGWLWWEWVVIYECVFIVVYDVLDVLLLFVELCVIGYII